VLAASWVTDDERPIGAERPAVDRARERHQVAIAAQHERGAVRRGHADRAQRVVDRVETFAPPSEEPAEEPA